MYRMSPSMFASLTPRQRMAAALSGLTASPTGTEAYGSAGDKAGYAPGSEQFRAMLNTVLNAPRIGTMVAGGNYVVTPGPNEMKDTKTWAPARTRGGASSIIPGRPGITRLQGLGLMNLLNREPDRAPATVPPVDPKVVPKLYRPPVLNVGTVLGPPVNLNTVQGPANVQPPPLTVQGPPNVQPPASNYVAPTADAQKVADQQRAAYDLEVAKLKAQMEELKAQKEKDASTGGEQKYIGADDMKLWPEAIPPHLATQQAPPASSSFPFSPWLLAGGLAAVGAAVWYITKK